MPRFRLHRKDFSIHKDSASAGRPSTELPPLNAEPERTLTPATTGSVNSIRNSPSIVAKHALGRTATIRSVPSFDGSESSPDSRYSKHSSYNSIASTVASQHIHDDSSSNHSKLLATPTKMTTDKSPETPSRWHPNGTRVLEPAEPAQDASIPPDAAEPTDGQWDSTIGKAGLGKTGRVINKLVSDNDALKRDIKIEQLKAEEAKQSAKLVEDKMDRMLNEYEGRLLEANVTKTLLARKERQVETLTAAVEEEKRRTTEALSREKNWREELAKVKKDTELKVDDATSYAQLMEGRYNAISSHWREQGEQVDRAATRLRKDIETLNEERRADDGKIKALRDLCDQQDDNIKELTRDRERIQQKFEEYKREQEAGLRNIKTEAKRREEEQERILEESREALAKLKWALNVKQNVKGAQ